MSILKNSIPKQRKGVGEHLSNQEWNDFINQLALQGNNHRDILVNISDEIFKFEWVEYEQEDNDTQIIKIPDNSLGTDVLTIEEFKNYLNGKDSQYKANEWMYYIVEYRRGTRVFKLISKGVFFLDLDEISNFIELLEKKVDKEDGKTLTSNDFTDLLKNKLDGIEEGAEKNINSNWFAQEGEKGFIENKPTHMLASDVFPWAKKINMDPTDVPGLNANKIIDGIFDPFRIPNLPMSKTTGLETELTRLENTKVSVTAFDIQMLQKLNIKPNGTDLLIINGMINPIYIDDTSYKDGHKIATSQSEMLSLQDVVVGTVVMRTDLNNELFILTALPASVLVNWQVASPNTLLSVAGRTGAVVLGITDIDGLSGVLNLKLDALTFESEVTRLEELINNKANDNEVVKTAGNQTIAGVKTFSSPVVVPNGTANNHAVNKSQLDTKVGKVAGKDLSSNDFTNELKNKLEGLEVVPGGEVDLNEMAYFDFAGRIYGSKYNLLVAAWEHSLTVDPSEIERNSTESIQYGKLQYPNGEDNGVIIPNSVTSIGDDAFSGWTTNNKPLVIPNSVTSIGDYAFYEWSANNHPLIIPNSVTSINSGTFQNWSANNHPLVIPNSVTSISGSAFNGWTSNNHPLVIPNSVTSISGSAFQNWSANNHPLVIPNSVTSIYNAAFMNWTTNNKPLVIPNSVTSIGDYAFQNWSNVPYIEMKSETPPTLNNRNAFGNQNNAPIYVPDSAVDAYKNATSWVYLADRIFPISERPQEGSGGIEDAPSDSKLYGRKDNTWEEIPEVPPMSSLPKPIYQARVNVINGSGMGPLFSSIYQVSNPDGLQEFNTTDVIYKRIKEITFVFKEEEYVDWENPPMPIFSEFKRIQSITIPLLIEYMPGMPGEPLFEGIDYLLFYPITFKKLDGSDVMIIVKPFNDTPLSGANDVAFQNLQVTVGNIDSRNTEGLSLGSPVQNIDVIIKYESRY